MDGLIVLALDGWEESVGVQAEIEHARKLGLSVIIVHPEQINNKDENFLNAIDHVQEI
jgi:citrate lyase beta subunit